MRVKSPLLCCVGLRLLSMGKCESCAIVANTIIVAMPNRAHEFVRFGRGFAGEGGAWCRATRGGWGCFLRRGAMSGLSQ